MSILESSEDAAAASLTALWRLGVSSSRNTDVDTPPRYTRFHSSSVPTNSLPNYDLLLCRRLRYDPACIGIALVLIWRYWQATQRPPSELTAHRLLVSALVVAGKLHMDRSHTTTSVGMVSGLSVRELNVLETTLLLDIAFDIFVDAADVMDVEQWLACATTPSEEFTEPAALDSSPRTTPSSSYAIIVE